MNEPDFTSLEADLQRLQPAQPPEEFLTRLESIPVESGHPTAASARQPHRDRFLAGAMPPPHTREGRAGSPLPAADWWRWLRWLTPATAAVATIAGGFLLWNSPRSKPASSPAPSLVQAVQPPLKANDVEIAKSQVATFDALGRLPDGAPVRLHCREWTDKVVVRDSARGIVIEQRTPRLEIVAVSFDTY